MLVKQLVGSAAEAEQLRLSACRNLSQILCTLTGVVGVTVLIGWYTDLSAVKSVFPGLATMKFNTALGFIFSSISLYSLREDRLSRHKSLTALASSSLLLLLSLMTLLQYLLNTSLGLDQLFVQDDATAPENYPGRMSMGTAINFVILAVSLLLLDFETPGGRRPTQFLTIVITFISGTALLGYLFGVTTIRLQLISSMALNTAVLFVLLGFAVWLARPASGLMQRLTSEQIGARLARIMLPVFTIVPILIGYLSFLGYRAGYYNVELGFALFCLVNVVILAYIGMTGARILNAAEQQSTATFESAPTAMIVAGSDGRIIRVNTLAEQAFGYERHEMIGQPIELLIPHSYRKSHPALRTSYLLQPTARRMGKERHLYGLRKDGSEFPVEVALNPIATRNGVVVLSAIVDITQRKAAETELKNRTEELARSNKDLEQFAYIASHDLQEPLRAVSGSVQLLYNKYEDKLDDRGKEFIAHAQGGVSRMQTLIEDLLTFSRLGKKDEIVNPVDCNLALDAALKNLAVLIRETGAVVTRGTLPTIPAYSSQIVLLLQNLVGNAIKFRRKDVIPTVTVETEELADKWQFTVADNGIGIDEQYFERIFVIFQRLHSRSEFSGTGMGLAICKRIVEHHGGEIWVESSPGVGTTFVFTLPKPSPV